VIQGNAQQVNTDGKMAAALALLPKHGLAEVQQHSWQ
jgi:hypothetical protein